MKKKKKLSILIGIDFQGSLPMPDTDWRNIVRVDHQSLEGREDSLSQAVARHHESDHFPSVLREPGDRHHRYY